MYQYSAFILWTIAGTIASGLPALMLEQPLKRVEQGIADTDPLRVGRRQLGHDLRAPSGYRDVYEVHMGPGAGPGTRRFVRQNGAVYAVFPRSIYQLTDRGVSAPVPPGTIYYLGGLPPDLARAANDSSLLGDARTFPRGVSSLTRSDSRADTSAGTAPMDTPTNSSLTSRPRPMRPRAAPDYEAGLPALASVSPVGRTWVSTPTGPSIMTDEAERVQAVTRVMSTLLGRAERE